MTYDDYDADAAERRFDHDMGQLERIQELESLVRDMWQTLSAMYDLKLGIDVGKERNYEQRMAALGLMEVDE